MTGSAPQPGETHLNEGPAETAAGRSAEGATARVRPPGGRPWATPGPDEAWWRGEPSESGGRHAAPAAGEQPADGETDRPHPEHLDPTAPAEPAPPPSAAERPRPTAEAASAETAAAVEAALREPAARATLGVTADTPAPDPGEPAIPAPKARREPPTTTAAGTDTAADVRAGTPKAHRKPRTITATDASTTTTRADAGTAADTTTTRADASTAAGSDGGVGTGSDAENRPADRTADRAGAVPDDVVVLPERSARRPAAQRTEADRPLAAAAARAGVPGQGAMPDTEPFRLPDRDGPGHDAPATDAPHRDAPHPEGAYRDTADPDRPSEVREPEAWPVPQTRGAHGWTLPLVDAAGRTRPRAPKPPRGPAGGLAALVVLSLLAAFFAWVSAEPLWLAVGHGDQGTATVTRCTGGAVTQRCTGRFTATGGSFTADGVALLGVSGPDRRPGASLPARMVAADSRQAYVGGAGDGLLHLRWAVGVLLVLLCGLGIAGATGARRLDHRRARRLAVLASVGAPLLLLVGFLGVAF